jgi:hypothetical protein
MDEVAGGNETRIVKNVNGNEPCIGPTPIWEIAKIKTTPVPVKALRLFVMNVRSRLSRIHAVERNINHRWTQMDTDAENFQGCKADAPNSD